MNIDKINTKKSFLKYLPFIIFFLIILIWHFILPICGDELWFADYFNYNIFNHLAFRYEIRSSRLLLEFFLIILAGLPRIIWIFLDSIVFLLIAVLIPKIMFNMEKIDEKKSFIYNSLACIIVLIYIFTISNALFTAGYIATTLNYTWSLFFGLLHFYLVKKYIFSENNSSTRQKIAIYALMIFSLIFAINQELMLVIVTEVYFLILLYCLYNKVKIPNSVLFMLFIIFLEFLNFYLCPGNQVRYITEMTYNFPDYYSLTLVNKVDLGITVLFNRIVLSYASYGLIGLFFFAILPTYIYSITKRRIPTIISLMPLIITITLGSMILMGYMPIVNFIGAGVTKYGLLHSNLKHILIISSIYAIIICSVMYSLIEIFKHGEKKLGSIIFVLLILGFTSQMMRGFSPTCWASGQRWEIYYYFCVTCATYILSVELSESRYDSCKNWLMNRKLWKFMYNLFSSRKNKQYIKRRLT